MKIVYERKISWWSLMSVDERQSILLNIMMSLTILGLLTIFAGCMIEKNLALLVDQYPILIRGLSLMIYLLGGFMLLLAGFIAIWYDTITHWSGFE